MTPFLSGLAVGLFAGANLAFLIFALFHAKGR